MASAQPEPITGVWRLPSPCKNSSELYQFQERAPAKVGGGVDMSTPVHPVATPLTLRSDLSYVCYHSPSSEKSQLVGGRFVRSVVRSGLYQLAQFVDSIGTIPVLTTGFLRRHYQISVFRQTSRFLQPPSSARPHTHTHTHTHTSISDSQLISTLNNCTQLPIDETSEVFPSLLILALLTVNLDLHPHTHPFNGPLSGTIQVSRYQKGKSKLDFTEARDSEWQWHQLGQMQV